MKFHLVKASPTLLLCLVGVSLVSQAESQTLNPNCIVSVLNRNVQVNADGTWILPNIPTGFGSVRARASCVNGGVTTSGQSNPFTITPNRMNAIPNIPLGNTTPIPTSLTLTAPTTNLSSAGQTVQFTATATYATGPSVNVTAGSAGTMYTVSNSAIATICANGLVTAVSTGVVVIQATNEGRSAISSVTILLAGTDSDGDGIPDDWEIAHGLNPHDPTDALLDLDHDGLNNLQEYRAGTDIRNADTDGDGINDGDEVNGTGLACNSSAQCFRTSPLLADTDGDGINDRTEILTGSDPTNAASVNFRNALTGIAVTPASFTLIVNSLTGTASVQLTVTGNVIDGTRIDLTSTTRGTSYLSNNLGICNFGSPDGRVFAGTAGACTITISNNGFVATSSGQVTNFTPADLSYVTVPGFANAVAVSGDYAYVAAGSSGLQVIGLSSDRTHPTVAAALALSGSSYDVKLVGNTAYLAGSSTLSVVDITNPLVPVVRGTFAAGNCLGLAISGSAAYLNCTSGLQIVNITNPAAMILVSSTSIGGTPWKIAIDSARHLAAMAMGSFGLKLVDITNPAAPVVKGTAATGDARAVALSGNWAYVADYTTSTNAVDITSLTAPVIRSHITPYTLGGYLQDIAVSGTFAFGADVVFVNGVPVTDISDPTNLQARSILNFTQRDDNGMGIALDSSFLYLVTDHSSLSRPGSSGDSRLYIGQYLPRQDLAGVPPSVSIASPATGSTVYQGAQLTVSVTATDDVAVASVDFLVNGQVVFTSTSTPYQYTFTVPTGVTTLTLGARARDLGNNIGTAQNVTLNVLPDPLTLVTGRVVNPGGTAVAGATVTATGGVTATTANDGSFSIPSVPTVLGNIQANAMYTPSGSSTLTGSSASVAPVLGGATNVGTIQLVSASFNTNYGTLVSRVDDDYYQYTLPFSFPFYGTARTTVYVGTNGYVTFGSGDSTYSESLPAFNTLPRIAAFFDDLYPGPSADPTSALYVNSTVPGQFIVTYLKDPHFNTSGPYNTLQIQLYSDGRIIFAYNGIGSLNTGTIVGITPGPNSPSLSIDYLNQRSVTVPSLTAAYEYFNGNLLFNLDQSIVIFTPTVAGSSYQTTTIAAPPAVANGVVTGGSGGSTLVTTSASTSGVTAAQIANAEVIVRSSGNLSYLGMTNTDVNGNFTLTKVPVGEIFVQIRRNGQIIAQGSGVFPGGSLTGAQALQIVITAIPTSTKTTPQGGN